MWYVYILKSLNNGHFYTGSTNDLERRLAEHNLGKSQYTRSRRPFELVYQESYNTRAEARRRELFLKSGKGRQFLKGVLRAISSVG